MSALCLKVEPCSHCGIRNDGAQGTMYCAPCLQWLQEWAASDDNTTPNWDPFDKDDVAARFPEVRV